MKFLARKPLWLALAASTLLRASPPGRARGAFIADDHPGALASAREEASIFVEAWASLVTHVPL
jgi:hypothetical protein